MPRRYHPWLLAALLCLTAAAIVPHAWLAEVCAPFAAVLKLVTASLGASGAHFLLFFALGAALLVAVPGLRRDLLPYLLILVSVAILQECAQLVFKARASGADEVHDLAMDLSGATVVWCLAAVPRLRPVREWLQILVKHC